MRMLTAGQLLSKRDWQEFGGGQEFAPGATLPARCRLSDRLDKMAMESEEHADVIESNLDDLSDQRDQAFHKGQVEYFRKMAIQWTRTAAQFRFRRRTIQG